MKLTENGLLTNNGKIVYGILGTLLCGIPLWMVDYHHYQLNSIYFKASCAGFGFIALLLVILSKYTTKKVFLYAAIPHVAAILIKVIIDCIPDPTNHNLWPFEIGMAVVFDLAIFLPVWVVRILIRLSKKQN